MERLFLHINSWALLLENLAIQGVVSGPVALVSPGRLLCPLSGTASDLLDLNLHFN